LILDHIFAASWIQTFEVTALIDKLIIDIFVDAGQAEHMPAVIDIKEDFSIEILIILSVTIFANYYLRLNA
jgi:hypothetical protein